jgi:hypothetical protein
LSVLQASPLVQGIDAVVEFGDAVHGESPEVMLAPPVPVKKRFVHAHQFTRRVTA